MPLRQINNTEYGVAYDVKWGGADIGYVDAVDPSGLRLVVRELRIGSLGDRPAGRRVTGIEGVIRVELREWNDELHRVLLPWAPATGSIPLLPQALAIELYDLAKELVLHPNDMGDDESEDYHFLKAVPQITLPKRDGKSDTVAIAEFSLFSRKEDEPRLNYGYIGATPPVVDPD